MEVRVKHRNTLIVIGDFGEQKEKSRFQFGFLKKSKKIIKIVPRIFPKTQQNHNVLQNNPKFKFTDIQACIALSELKRFKTYLKSLVNLYKLYFKKLNQSKDFYIIPVNVKSGELPQYIEVIAKKRDKLVNFLIKSKIFTRKFYPNMNSANYLKVENNNRNFNDDYSRYGLYLPSGTNQNTKDIKKVITKINEFNKKKN